MYTNYQCPYAQRTWITRNFKVALVFPLLLLRESNVPSLEHDGKIMGESLDIIKYIDSNFEGPSLLPSDSDKKQFAEELLDYSDTFNANVYSAFKADPLNDIDPVFDYLENALWRFHDGPFFLGQFSLVDIAYLPFIERFQVFLSEVFKYNITAGRPGLEAWIEECNKIEAYKPTKVDPKETVVNFSKRFLA
ncbi:Glutathione S-transferase L3 [Linum perenne]